MFSMISLRGGGLSLVHIATTRMIAAWQWSVMADWCDLFILISFKSGYENNAYFITSRGCKFMFFTASHRSI